MDSAEAHRQLSQGTGAAQHQVPHRIAATNPPPPRLAETETLGQRLVAAGNQMVTSFGAVVDQLGVFADAVSKLLEALDDLVDDDGREIWLTAGEVELDQWTQLVIDRRDVVRRALRGAP